MKKNIAVFIITLFLAGCMNKESNFADAGTTKVSEEPAMNSPVSGSENESYQKNDEGGNKGTNGNDLKISGKGEITQKIPVQIIKNSNVQFQVKDVEVSHQKIATLLKQYNSYFGSDNKTTNSYQIENNMVIRVPSTVFEKLMDELMKESVYTNYKNISAEDVTAEFVDIEARLKTKKEVEQRYIALLRQSNKVADILEVENYLRVIREEIEAAEGRLKLLKDQVGYSTITLNAYQKLDYTPEPEIGFLSNLTEAFVRGWRSLVELVIGLVRVWPFVILFGAALFFGIRKIRNRRK